jgi:acyl-coenzyme A synthetase/AMP-(fatty) acid ligase
MVCESKDPERDGLLQAIRGRVAAETGVKITHLTVQPPNSLPRTTSGKRQRRLVRRFFLSMRGGA